MTFLPLIIIIVIIVINLKIKESVKNVSASPMGRWFKAIISQLNNFQKLENTHRPSLAVEDSEVFDELQDTDSIDSGPGGWPYFTG